MTTHYFNTVKKPSLQSFRQAVEDCEKLSRLVKIKIAGWDGTGSPLFGEKEICFNGAHGEGCETFRLVPIVNFEFCKTMDRPYDFIVRCCLIIFSHHLGTNTFQVSSDDKSLDPDTAWYKAKHKVEEVLGYGMDFVLAR